MSKKKKEETRICNICGRKIMTRKGKKWHCSACGITTKNKK